MGKIVHKSESIIFLQSERYGGESCWRPAVDVYHFAQGWLVKIDLAGVLPQDVQVSLEGRRLRVSGVRRDLSIFEGLRAHSLEIAYNRFERSIELPCDLEQNVHTQFDYRDGMFLLRILTEASR